MALVPNGDLDALFKLVNGNLDQTNFGTRLRLDADYIRTGKIESSDQLTYFDLDNNVLYVNNGTITGSDINGTTITGGEINGTTITGGIIQTDDSGARVIINYGGDENSIRITDDNSVPRIMLEQNLINFFDASGNGAGGIGGAFDAEIGSFLSLSSDNIYVGAAKLVFDDQNENLPLLYCDTSSVIQLEGADLYVNGDVGGDTKSFIIDHPTKDGYKLRYVCPESPEVLAMCRGNGEVKLPDHFVAVTVPESVQIIKDQENGNWLATGVRVGYEEFDPEIINSNPEPQYDPKEFVANALRQKKNQDESPKTESKESIEQELDNKDISLDNNNINGEK